MATTFPPPEGTTATGTADVTTTAITANTGRAPRPWPLCPTKTRRRAAILVDSTGEGAFVGITQTSDCKNFQKQAAKQLPAAETAQRRGEAAAARRGQRLASPAGAQLTRMSIADSIIDIFPRCGPIIGRLAFRGPCPTAYGAGACLNGLDKRQIGI